jgi:ATP-dependent DNA helicase RecG
MDLKQLKSLVTQGESEILEFKRTTRERREAMHTLCAMLNHRGGRVLFGVEPSGSIIGQQVSDHTIEEVAQEIQQIEPTIFPQIDRIDVKPGYQVLSVYVTTGPNVPYSYKGQAYRRMGNTSPKLSRNEYNRILIERFHGERRWETELANDWTVEDLDASEITRTADEAIRQGRLEDPGTRQPLELLRGFGLLKDERLMRAAVILFGKQNKIEAELPQCMIRAARFRGTDKSEFIDNKQFYGNAFDLLLKAQRFLLEHLPIAGRIVPGVFERIDEPLYPPVALREALANAICHRDYSSGAGSIGVAIYQDRLEITSEGKLHFDFTPEKLFQPHESKPWNPLIARVFHRRGIIERWGRGTLKMAELTQQAGLPRPEIEEGTDWVLVRFRPSRYVPPQEVKQDLSERQQLILQLLAEKPGIGRKAIQKSLGFNENETKSDLVRLHSLGLVRQEGKGRGTVLFLANTKP